MQHRQWTAEGDTVYVTDLCLHTQYITYCEDTRQYQLPFQVFFFFFFSMLLLKICSPILATSSQALQAFFKRIKISSIEKKNTS